MVFIEAYHNYKFLLREDELVLWGGSKKLEHQASAVCCTINACNVLA